MTTMESCVTRFTNRIQLLNLKILKVVRLFPAPGPWSSLAPIGIKRLSSSSELSAQYV